MKQNGWPTTAISETLELMVLGMRNTGKKAIIWPLFHFELSQRRVEACLGWVTQFNSIRHGRETVEIAHESYV